jgi:hypothetical protein
MTLPRLFALVFLYMILVALLTAWIWIHYPAPADSIPRRTRPPISPHSSLEERRTVPV